MSTIRSTVPTTAGESLALELTSRSINGHSQLSLVPPYLYSDRFTNQEKTPVSELSTSLVIPHISRDTVIYTLPGTGGTDGRELLFKELWSSWYPVRPVKLRIHNDEGKSTHIAWNRGERFFALPVSVRDLPDADNKGEGGVNVPALATMTDFHEMLVRRIMELEEDVRMERGRAGMDYKLGKAFDRSFVVLDRALDAYGGEIMGLLVTRRDASEELRQNRQLMEDEAIRNLADGRNKAAELSNDAGQWEVRRLRIEVAVRIVAALDDPQRLQGDVPLSEEYVRRFLSEDGR